MIQTVRVHETDSETTVSFNLDDWEQFDSYVLTLAANAGTRLLSCGANTHSLASYGYQATLESQSRGRITLTASLEKHHARDCYTCFCAFDRHAGNATAAFA